jgi:hypothetical protein
MKKASRPTLLYPTRLSFEPPPKQIASKLKKLLKKAESEQHNKMLMERTKLILTLTTQIFFRVLLLKLFASAAFHQISVWAQSKLSTT